MTDIKTKNRKIIIILVVLFLAPLLYAIYVFNSDWRPATTSNYGELIIPARPLEPFALKTITGEKFSLENLKRKWAMIYVGPASCKKACQDNLYKMRQVHTLQAKKQPRVQRVMILTDNKGLPELEKLLKKEYPKLIVVNGAAENIKKFTDQFIIKKGETVANQHRIYYMDPLGNLMMYYAMDSDGQDMHKDLKKLLRRSHIG